MAVEARAAAPATQPPLYDGATADEIARRLGVPRVALYESVGSTMDAGHGLAASGAPAGTVVLADEQTAGRGRQGSAWLSARGRGVWVTVLERPGDADSLDVLSLRVGLAASTALAALARGPVRVKWPNDLFVGEGKLAGVLVEARWRGGRPDWVAIGLGVNVSLPPDLPHASALRDGTPRLDALAALVPAVREAAARTGPLDERELNAFAARDYARGRRCVRPAAGVVVGVTAAGELVVDTAVGVRRYRAGSLVLRGDA